MSRKQTRTRSPSPPPVSGKLPSFLPEPDDENAKGGEDALKARFKQFWMSTVVDAFHDDLEEIRKARLPSLPLEPNMTKARLTLLIDALASGANVFSSSSNTAGASQGVNEMELVLD
ncbi:hypothetical protein FISHEDRAFT_46383 [Fistulina hepatica ATCC 64428]|uniref:Ribosome assembly protein 3 n=1 Tax=Fistulina hepatica ATCC 64428 TaxID=1128425 RepID=A0A0D7AAE3_9AGAR|nr:hypothetical protein FISHEDRAFT_46383 [Fistulina hepatica ATCC 64428]